MLHLSDNFLKELNFHTLFRIVNPEIDVPDPDGQASLQNVLKIVLSIWTVTFLEDQTRQV